MLTYIEMLDKYFEFLNKYEKLYAEDFDSKYDDYRDNIQKEKTDFINKTQHVCDSRTVVKRIFK